MYLMGVSQVIDYIIEVFIRHSLAQCRLVCYLRSQYPPKPLLNTIEQHPRILLTYPLYIPLAQLIRFLFIHLTKGFHLLNKILALP